MTTETLPPDEDEPVDVPEEEPEETKTDVPGQDEPAEEGEDA